MIANHELEKDIIMPLIHAPFYDEGQRTSSRKTDVTR